MTDKEFKQRKQQFQDPVAIAWLKAGAKVFWGGDEKAAWLALFESVDRHQKDQLSTTVAIPSAARLHLRATHQ